ncbi:MAG: hypothetical protein JWM34_200 [Ilumatobacteraceae bacterium]|nr:hypothetical protein [Ilumatobacteraceae bacterium]
MVDDHLGGFIVALTTLPFLIIVGILIRSMLRSANTAKASLGWPVVPGTIMSSQVTTHRSLNADSSTHTTMYAPEVSYVYAVNGQQLTSDNVSFTGVAGESWSSGAEAVVARYPPGAAVQVHYNPANPAEAALEHSAGGTSSLVLIVLGAVEVLLVVLLVLGLTGRFG